MSDLENKQKKEKIKMVVDKYFQEIDSIIPKIVNDAYFKINQRVYKEINKIKNKAVDNFYNNYDPNSYRRKKDLYDAFFVSFDNKTGNLKYKIGGDNLMNHRADNDYIYEMAFVEGWHGGGVPKNPDKVGDWDLQNHYMAGVPFYRTPYPTFHSWGDRAKKAPVSPLDEIIRNWNHYINQSAVINMNTREFVNTMKKYI